MFRGECPTPVQMFAIISSSVWQVASVFRYHPPASPFAVKVRRDAMPRRTHIIAVFSATSRCFFPREDADIRRCTQTTDERSTTSAVTSAHSLFNHRSISLTKFRKGEAQLPTKPRPYRKSFFKQTATKASARLPNHTAFDS